MTENHRFHNCGFLVFHAIFWEIIITLSPTNSYMKKVRAESTLTHFPIRATPLQTEKASCQKYVSVKLAKLTSFDPISRYQSFFFQAWLVMFTSLIE